jgi:hypothetical protein
MTSTNKDSFKVTENEDGTLAVEWDPNDPQYSFLNDMTQEELNAFFTRAIEELITSLEENPDEPVQ